jgi:hypothetical protein
MPTSHPLGLHSHLRKISNTFIAKRAVLTLQNAVSALSEGDTTMGLPATKSTCLILQAVLFLRASREAIMEVFQVQRQKVLVLYTRRFLSSELQHEALREVPRTTLSPLGLGALYPLNSKSKISHTYSANNFQFCFLFIPF